MKQSKVDYLPLAYHMSACMSLTHTAGELLRFTMTGVCAVNNFLQGGIPGTLSDDAGLM